MELFDIKKGLNIIKKIVYRLFFGEILPIYHRFLVWRLRRKKQINVVFVAMSVSMWRYQGLYEELRKNSRFKISILIIPCRTYAKEQQCKDVEGLIEYFNERGVPYFLGKKDDKIIVDINRELQPDILFYPQPYRGLFDKEQDFYRFRFKLLCYFPYAFWMSTGNWSYNLSLHNYGWKLFYSTELHKQEAKKCAYNRGCNVKVVGYPNADRFLNTKHPDVWKKQDIKKKRIIWAPHFTIFSGGLVEQSNFLWMADFMLECAKRYKDQIQFIFKPHPKLYTELCKHDDWGKNKAADYYKQWQSGENTQLETGEHIDIFMTSDAMIHDSGSFCVEYHYTQKPVMYIARTFLEQVENKSQFGQIAMLNSYIGKSEVDIISFIENVVIINIDPMKKLREEFYKKYLLPPHGKTVAENTVDILLQELC